MPKLAILITVLVVLLVPTIYLWWPSGSGNDIPPPQTAEQLAALPDDQVNTVIATDLLWKAAQAQDYAKWRSMAEPARVVFALAEIERTQGTGPLNGFPGVGSLVELRGMHRPNLDEIAAAYTAIGAPQAATAILAVKTRKAGVPSYDELDHRLQEARRHDGTAKLLLAYIRTHVSEITSAKVTE